MKKINLIIYLLFLILLSSSVSAIEPDHPNLLAWLKMDDASGSMTDSSTGTADYGFSVKPDVDTGLYQATKVPSYSTYSYDFDGCTAQCYGFQNNSINDVLGGTSACDFTINLWYEGGRDVSSSRIISSEEDDPGRGIKIYYDGTTITSSYFGELGDTDSVSYDFGTAEISAMLTLKLNVSSITLYTNGTQRDADHTLSCGNQPTSADHLYIGWADGDAYGVPGRIDEVSIFNISLTDAEIMDMYNDGIQAAPPPGVPIAPTIEAPSPADNSHNNTNVTLNVSHDTINNDVRYYLYFNTSSTLDEGDLIYNNATRNGSEHSNWNTGVGDGIYYWKWRVQNISNGAFSTNTTQRTLYIDTVTPTITIFQNTSFKTDNSTIISGYLNNFAFNISFFDVYLYQTLINITNSTGNSVFNITNTSIGGKTTANYSRNIDISGWSIGNYTIKLVATDSHTAKEIKEYDIKTGLSYFRYTTKEGNIIKITSDTLPLTKKTTKLKDRYDFKFSYLLQKDTYKFIIESYNKINYIKDSGYKAHFVIMGSNGRGNWLDFENPNLDKKDYKITKIDDYIYEVEITAKGLKSFTFSSLGGLNTKEEHYLLRLGAVLDVQVGDDETGDWINATVTIGNQIINTTVYNQSNITAARFVNITKETTSLTLTATGYGTETKAMSVTDKYHNLSFNMTPVSAAKLYFYDEKSGTLIAGESFSVYLETTGFSNTYSGINTTSDNPYTITGLINGLYKLKASSANYPERQYLDLNISNVTTTTLNIYLINSTLGSEITFNIVDEALNPLEDVFVVFTRIINGTSTVIAEEDSDFAGQCRLYLDENYEYTINFSKTDYEIKTITLEPTESEYIITMVSTVGLYNQSVYEGIRYRFEPSNIVLNNNTKYNFTFTLNSTVWTVTNCNLTLKNGSNILSTTTGYTSTGCYLRIEQDTFNMATITSEAIYELNDQYAFTVSQQYSVIYTYEGEFSLKNFLDDLSDFAMAGFDDFGRMILALIVIFVITALAAQKIGFTNPEVLIFLVIAQVWFFSYVNWFYLDFTPIPTIAGFDLKKYIIAVLVSLAGGAFVMRKFTD